MVCGGAIDVKGDARSDAWRIWAPDLDGAAGRDNPVREWPSGSSRYTDATPSRRGHDWVSDALASTAINTRRIALALLLLVGMSMLATVWSLVVASSVGSYDYEEARGQYLALAAIEVIVGLVGGVYILTVKRFSRF